MIHGADIVASLPDRIAASYRAYPHDATGEQVEVTLTADDAITLFEYVGTLQTRNTNLGHYLDRQGNVLKVHQERTDRLGALLAECDSAGLVTVIELNAAFHGPKKATL